MISKSKWGIYGYSLYCFLNFAVGWKSGSEREKMTWADWQKLGEARQPQPALDHVPVPGKKQGPGGHTDHKHGEPTA